MLVNIKGFEDTIVLWAIANSVAYVLEVSADVVAENADFSTSWFYKVC